MIVLGIETSCDETAAAIVDPTGIRANVVHHQIDLHAAFGGVVPEIACRSHLETVLPVIRRALEDASLDFTDLDGIAVTNRPGLVGALLIGLTAAKTLAWSLSIPFLGVDHIEAHLDSVRLVHHDLAYPLISLIASGGHTSLYLSRSPVRHDLLGATRDDAVGEAFDKVATILGLGYPGGPAIEREALRGDATRISLPRPKRVRGRPDFSFSGLKTAVLYLCQGQNTKKGHAPLRPEVSVPDMAAAFQEAAVERLVEPTIRAARTSGVRTVAIGGGVACNRRLREALGHRARREGLDLRLPPPELCTDNAAMVAGLGRLRLCGGERDALDLEPYPRLRPRG